MSIEELFDSLNVGTLYYFSDPLIAEGKKHHFLCIDKTQESESILLGVCTTSYDFRKKLVLQNNGDLRTLVEISYEGNNHLTETTHIDCNDPIVYEFDDLESIYKHNQRLWAVTGQIANEELESIISGILLSNRVERYIQNHLRVLYPHL